MMRWVPILGLVVALSMMAASDPGRFVAVVGGAAAIPDEWFEPADDPFPIRRVFVTPDQLADRVAAAGNGPYLQLSRSEFEGKVRAAARAKSDPPPQIVVAAYSASLIDTRLTGTGTWSVAYPTPRPGSVPLEPLRVAITSAKWDGGRPAVVYRSAAGPAHLWADPANGSSVHFDWSARAAAEPGEVRFDLRLPVAAVATLDLRLPAKYTVSVSRSDVLVSGPYPGPTPAERVWKIAFGSQPRLDLTVRTDTHEGRPAPLARAHVDSVFEFTPGSVDVTYAFELEPIRGSSMEWTFDVDPRLRVVAVTIPGGGTWDGGRATPGRPPDRLRVRPADPEAGGRLIVRATTVPPPAGARWSLPSLRLAAGVTGNETVIVRLHPDLYLNLVDPGDFLLSESAATADEYQSMTWTPSLSSTSGRATRMPVSVGVRLHEPEVSAVETLTWSIRPDQSRLTAELNLSAVHGPVIRVVVELPEGYQPRSVTTSPEDPAAGWAKSEGTKNTWIFEPSRPLIGKKSTTLSITLTGPPASTATPTPFPRIEVLGAASRIGTFKLDSAPELDAVATPAIPPVGMAYRGDPPAGQVVVRHRPSPDASPSPKSTPKEGAFVPPAGAYTTPDGVSYWFTSATVRVESSGTTYKADGFVLPSQTRRFLLPLSSPLELHSLRVADRWVDNPKRELDAILVPVPNDSSQPIPFELTLHGPSPGGFNFVSWDLHPKLPTIQWSAGPEYRFFPELSRERTAISAGIVRTSWVIAAGLVTTLPILALWYWFGSRRFGRLGVFVLLLLLGGCLTFFPAGWGLFLGPPFAVAVIAAVAQLHGLIAAVKMRAVVVICVAGGVTVAQAPEPVTVFVVREESGELSVHASRSVLDRLDSLAAAPLPVVLIASADYQIAELDGGVEVTAIYQVFASGPMPRLLQVPLSVARLTGMTLDDEPAFPTSQVGGYAVSISKPGWSQLVARLFVPIADPGSEREISFSVPDVPQSRLTFRARPISVQPAVIAARGAQRLTSTAAGPVLSADLGGLKSVAVKWQVDSVDPKPGLEVRSLAVWDLGIAESTLTVAYQIRSAQGRLTRLALDVPAGLEPGRATVRSMDATGTLSAPVAVRDWTLGPMANGSRPLTLEFAQPVDRQAVIVVTFVPDAVPSTRPHLRFPYVSGENRIEYLIGLRIDSVTAGNGSWPGLIEVTQGMLTRQFGAVPELQLDKKPLTVTLQPADRTQVELSPTLGGGTTVSKREQVDWTVGPGAEAAGSVAWTAAGDGTSVIPITVPQGLTLTDLSGAEWHSRTRVGSQVAVWLKRNTKSGVLAWRASLPVTAHEFDLPLAGDPARAEEVAILPADGWTVSITPSPTITVRPREGGGYDVTSKPGARAVRVLVKPLDSRPK